VTGRRTPLVDAATGGGQPHQRPPVESSPTDGRADFEARNPNVRAPIVCGVDGSPASYAAARLARTMAHRLGLPLELVHATSMRDKSERRALAQALRAGLDDDFGAGAVLTFETGAPQKRLVEVSRRAALVVMGTRGAGAIRRALTGSVTAPVTRSAAAPVIVVPPAAARTGRWELRGGVICAVRDEQDLAVCATAACWSRELDLPLTLAHVVPPPPLPVTPGGGRPPAGLALSAGEQIADARAMLDELARKLSPSSLRSCRTRVRDGDVGEALVRLAAAERAGLVVIGAHARGSRSSAFKRSTWTHLLRRAACPVMVCPSLEAVLAQRSPCPTGAAVTSDQDAGRHAT
jgi:nucleotide-binding universal stress UspA family protein